MRMMARISSVAEATRYVRVISYLVAEYTWYVVYRKDEREEKRGEMYGVEKRSRSVGRSVAKRKDKSGKGGWKLAMPISRGRDGDYLW